MKSLVDKKIFGPWAVVTGASSGIGKAFAQHLAASGLNVVLAARRLVQLQEVGRSLAADFGVEYRAVQADLTEENFLEKIEGATGALDIGLVIGNAGFATPGEFLTIERDELLRCVRLKVDANLVLAHHFGRRLAARGQGGLLLVSSIGGLAGVPYVANTAGVEAYVLALGEGLHVELKQRGIHLTVLMPGPTATESMTKMGVDPGDMPVQPMSAERCAAEGLMALQANRATHIAGGMNRFMSRLMPRSVATRLMGAMIGKKFARKALAAASGQIGIEPAVVPDDATKTKPLTVGATAPAVSLRNADGSAFEFRPDQLDRPVIVIFYRGGWCPYCNAHLEQLREIETPLREFGYRLLFVSPDRPELLYSGLRDSDVKYTLLSDSTLAARVPSVSLSVSTMPR